MYSTTLYYQHSQSVFQVEVLTYFLCYNYHDIEMRLKADRKFGCFCLCYGYASFHSLLQPLADCVSSNFFPLLLVGMKAKFAPFGISKGISREIQCQHPGNTHTHTAFVLLLKSLKMALSLKLRTYVAVLIRRRRIRIG